MICLDYPLQKMLDEISFDDTLRFPCLAIKALEHANLQRDFIIYSKVNHLFDINHNAPFSNPIRNRLPSEAEYMSCWPMMYPEALNRVVEDVIALARHSALDFVLENAFHHGDLPITVTTYLGKDGTVYEVEDSGRGFDVAKTFTDYNAGRRYCSHTGYGFKNYDAPNIVTSFDKEGKVCRLMVNTERMGSNERVT